jgi:hypothetical protein
MDIFMHVLKKKIWLENLQAPRQLPCKRKDKQAVEAYRVVTRRGPNVFIASRLTDGGKVSITLRLPFTCMKIPGALIC